MKINMRVSWELKMFDNLLDTKLFDNNKLILR